MSKLNVWKGLQIARVEIDKSQEQTANLYKITRERSLEHLYIPGEFVEEFLYQHLYQKFFL